ncbi:MAG: SDR family oxidoreductase [Bacteroidetes bacterium]|nr:SDR family oxidoreductase [Bacteroidota bacterium]
MNKPGFDDLNNKIVVITGGAGVIGTSIAIGLGWLGMKTVILDIDPEAAGKTAETVQKTTGSLSFGIPANVLDKQSLQSAKEVINKTIGKIDFLINGAGGNSPKATTQVEEILPTGLGHLEATFYGLEMEGFQRVFDLNFMGTLLPTMVFTDDMLAGKKGAVLNISSLNSFRPLTKIPAYSAAKAAVNNFTEWLAVHLAKTGIRVNAISPGFFLTNQNRFLLIDEETGKLKPRGEKIINNTPMGRFGEPDELLGAVAYLLSDCSRFVTGTVLLVDGGFNAYSGV